MKSAAEYLLSFLLNAGWQVAFIGGMAALADLLLRRAAARHRHLIWVAALFLSLALPLLASLRPFSKSQTPSAAVPAVVSAPAAIADSPAESRPAAARASLSALNVSSRVAFVVVAIFALLFIYRAARLVLAWFRTRAAKADAIPFARDHRVQAIAAECQGAINAGEITLMSSARMSTPATVGLFRPLIILPERMARDASDDELTAAVGHELVHVWRRDYLLNLIYEIIFLPLSFHPAAIVMRRRITQTRELRCDELVSERLLRPDVYARSLVQLAHSAMPLARRARTVAVGIADADILEVRVMSLLKRTSMDANRKRVWLLAAALLLVLPCVAAAVFAFHLNIDTARAQEPSSEEKRKVEFRKLTEQQVKEDMQRRAQRLEEQIKSETNSEVRANLEQELAKVIQQMERPIGMATAQGENYVMLADPTRARMEFQLQQKHNEILAQIAKISMDQAIQIATSKTPGKVTECSLVGERWSAPDELAKPSLVLYHVVILAGDENAPVTYHVLVNAVDGTIFKSERSEPRRENQTESNQNGWSILRKTENGEESKHAH